MRIKKEATHHERLEAAEGDAWRAEATRILAERDEAVAEERRMAEYAGQQQARAEAAEQERDALRVAVERYAQIIAGMTTAANEAVSQANAVAFEQRELPDGWKRTEQADCRRTRTVITGPWEEDGE